MRLAEDEAHLWWWSIPRLTDGPPATRLRSNWVWSRVRPVLAQYAGIDDADLVIERSENGKPQAPQLDAAFSLSHDDDIALLALARSGCVGVDVMGARAFGSARLLARRIFKDHELQQWEGAAKDARFDLLRTRFCVTEAVVKALDWRLWPALGGIHVVREGRIARVPLKRAQLHLASGQRDRHIYALASDRVLTSVRHIVSTAST
jgi:4'-phosphopantetheinyl transferase EntD